MPVILALDPSPTGTGYALGGEASGEVQESGTIDWMAAARSAGVADHEDALIEAFAAFDRWLRGLLADRPNIAVVAVEIPRFNPKSFDMNGSGATVYMSFQAQVIASEYGRRYLPTEPQTVRRDVLGRGNLPKRKILSRVQMLGYNPCDDDEADAISILLYAQGHHRQMALVSAAS